VTSTKRDYSDPYVRNLVDELGRYEARFGAERLARLLRALQEVVRWLAEQGHGKVTIPGKDHAVGVKLTEESIITLDDLAR
jgi:hypothetical protein